MTIRVVVADDHPLFREGLRAVVEKAPGLTLAGEASSGEEALVLAEQADVVLMDLRMPGIGGLEATRRIARAVPACAVLVLTMSEDDEAVAAAVRSGARGFLVKGASPEAVVAAVEAVHRGEAVFGADVAGRVLARVAAPGSRPFPQLTERERDVLRLLALGLDNAAIAQRLALAPKSVRNLVSGLLAKLGLDNRHDAADLARKAGLGRS